MLFSCFFLPTAEVSDRRRQPRRSARGTPKSPPDVERKHGAAVRLHRLVRHHSVTSSLKSSYDPLQRPPPHGLPVQLEKIRSTLASRYCALHNEGPFISVPYGT